MAPRSEKREVDGVKYSRQEFIEFYGEKKGQKQWDAAAPKEQWKPKKAARPADRDIKLYASPRCPFARRAMIAIHEKGLTHELIPIPLSGELKKLESLESPESPVTLPGWEGRTAEELKKVKADFVKDVNPSGEVPALVLKGNTVTEADVVVEYLQDAFPKEGNSLMPRDALQRSKIRHYLKHLGGPGGVSGMYGLLMNQDPTKDESFREKVYKQFESFSKMAGEDGPYFLGKTFTIVDVLLMPMFDQFRYSWPHYRGTELIPSDTAAFPWAARMQKWAEAVQERESFKSSTQGKEMYIRFYASYAGARGVAKFGA